MVRQNELYHYGVLGMRWGVRRYQNYDGTLKHPKGSSKGGTKARKKLSDKQKRAIIGAAVGVGVAAAAGVSIAYLAKHPELLKVGKDAVSNLITKQVRFDGGSAPINALSEKYGKVADNQSWNDALMNADPHGGKHNCGAVSLSVLAQQNQKANIVAKDIPEGMTWDDVEKVVPGITEKGRNTQLIGCDTSADIGDAIRKKCVDGDNGLLGLWSKQASEDPNHFVDFRCENGKTIISDGQLKRDKLGFVQKLPNGEEIRSIEFSTDGSSVKINGRDMGANQRFVDMYLGKYNFDLSSFSKANDLSFTSDDTILNKYFEGRK